MYLNAELLIFFTFELLNRNDFSFFNLQKMYVIPEQLHQGT